MDKKRYLEEIDNVIANGRYKDTWESLSQFEVPQWYRDAKFGIFIHWGVYSVPAFGSEWYPRNMYQQGSAEYEHHIKTYGSHKDFGYKDFIPMFTAEKFDPAAWAELFAEAGARYVMPVAEHHDGFQMYKSGLSRWNAKDMGPKRDILQELYTEFEKRNLKCCASSHRIEHWFFMSGGREFESDFQEPVPKNDLYWPSVGLEDLQGIHAQPGPSAEFMEDWLLRTCELIDQYRPCVLYFDWWIRHNDAKPYIKKLAAYYYNRAEEWGMQVAINYKFDAYSFGSAVLDMERGGFADVKPFFWQTCTAIAKNSWGYTENNDYKKAKVILCDLMDVVSKNGCMLLNVGPKADGSIGPEDTAVLREIGAWMKINGEAVYGSKIWRVAAEGPTEIVEGQFTDATDKVFTSEDFRFTAGHGAIYAASLNFPESGEVLIRSLRSGTEKVPPVLGADITDVRVLGFDETPKWTRSEEGLRICTTAVRSDKPVVFKIEVL